MSDVIWNIDFPHLKENDSIILVLILEFTWNPKFTLWTCGEQGQQPTLMCCSKHNWTHEMFIGGPFSSRVQLVSSSNVWKKNFTVPMSESLLWQWTVDWRAVLNLDFISVHANAVTKDCSKKQKPVPCMKGVWVFGTRCSSVLKYLC